MPVSTHRGQVKGGVLQEWRVGSINLKEDRVLIKTLGMINVQKKAFATLMKVDRWETRALLLCYILSEFHIAINLFYINSESIRKSLLFDFQ